MAKAAVVSDGEDLPEDGDGNNDGGDDDNNRDDDNQAINLPDTATANNEDEDNDIEDNGEGMPRKTLVTATNRRKTDAADADIPEGGD